MDTRTINLYKASTKPTNDPNLEDPNAFPRPVILGDYLFSGEYNSLNIKLNQADDV